MHGGWVPPPWASSSTATVPQAGYEHSRRVHRSPSPTRVLAAASLIMGFPQRGEVASTSQQPHRPIVAE